ncbi:hypothetical protein [Roseateles chitinivorans]|uniref:hypothetical protein n=1 Tax=Roseateles chitinivorans TaxID=2917965 RepID=UPI003D669095
MHFAALRSLIASHVPGLAASTPDAILHHQRQASLGRLLGEFYNEGCKLQSSLYERTIERVCSTPDLIRALTPDAAAGGRLPAWPTSLEGKPMCIVPLPADAAPLAKTVAAGDRYVLPVHAGVPEPDPLYDLLNHCDIARMLGQPVVIREEASRPPKPYQSDALRALICAAVAVRDAVWAGGPDLSWDDAEVVREACQRVPVDLVAQLRAEDLAGLLAFTFHCKARCPSPRARNKPVQRPLRHLTMPEARSPLTGTRSSPPR